MSKGKKQKKTLKKVRRFPPKPPGGRETAARQKQSRRCFHIDGF